jgi:hypothetical protein
MQSWQKTFVYQTSHDIVKNKQDYPCLRSEKQPSDDTRNTARTAKVTGGVCGNHVPSHDVDTNLLRHTMNRRLRFTATPAFQHQG